MGRSLRTAGAATIAVICMLLRTEAQQYTQLVVWNYLSLDVFVIWGHNQSVTKAAKLAGHEAVRGASNIYWDIAKDAEEFRTLQPFKFTVVVANMKLPGDVSTKMVDPFNGIPPDRNEKGQKVVLRVTCTGLKGRVKYADRTETVEVGMSDWIHWTYRGGPKTIFFC